MQPLEDTKDTLMKFRGNANSVVFDPETCVFAAMGHLEPHHWSRAWRHKFDRIGKQVANDLSHGGLMSHDSQEGSLRFYDRSTLTHGLFQLMKRLHHDVL